MLADRSWQRKYTPDDGDLVTLFYVPALQDAVRYDRLTGYFNAGALALAARGIKGLVGNRGHMRLIAGCTLGPPEVEAITRGEELRDLVERRLTGMPLEPPDAAAGAALELLAWMIARGYLDVKVAVPCDPGGRPIALDGIFHEKAGIIADRAGNRVAWNGSLNETVAGWKRNWESINVYTSWGAEPDRVSDEEANFARMWANRSRRVIVLDVPGAVRRDLMRFLPSGDRPARLREVATEPEPEQPASPQTELSQPEAPVTGLRARVWGFIERAATLPVGATVGEATAAVTPWPHQIRAFDRLYRSWPPRLLIADEVGLGKTIQAGLLLRQAWLAGRARRILILAPKAVLNQWQLELREKFNLNWPIYDGRRLVRYPSPALRGRHEQPVESARWHEEPAVIASSQLMRRGDRAAVLLEGAEPWDLVVLDEAHHARRQAAGARWEEDRPNALLRLMRQLARRTDGLLLLTATPLQVHPIEVWDLLHLLGLPPEWTEAAFLDFFSDLEKQNPSVAAMERMARLFQAVERAYGPVETPEVQRLADLSRLRANRVLRALRDGASIPRRQLESAERRAALAIMRAHTPVRRLVSRHTRELLRGYYRKGLLTTPIADRRVEDRFVEMTPAERDLHDEVRSYISTTYQQAAAAERTAVGFVMTVYGRRLASSFYALGATLRRHRDAIAAGSALTGSDEDAPDDTAADEVLEADEVAALERAALAAEEQDAIERLLARIAQLPPDSKLGHLRSVLGELRTDGFGQVMVFTQYTDTMDFLRRELGRDEDWRLMCFSGRGGEIPSADGSWRTIDRDEARRRFRAGEAEVLLCNDAAAEGLNFQFCGALINYDMPWNPMRVEQRIGRIDRLGQKHRTIRIVNLHYADTIETDVYQVLRDRIGLFQSVVGRLQPILAQLPRTITAAVLAGSGRDSAGYANALQDIALQTRAAETGGFDLDAVLDEDLAMPTRSPSPVTMEDLDRLIRAPHLMPPGTEVLPLGPGEYGLLAPGMREPLRVTTDPAYYEANAESVEFWSPGNPLFQPPDLLPPSTELPANATGTLCDLLES